jgi:TetR/AcrR family transcriptional regulator
MNLFFDKLEAALRQMLREAPGVVDSPAPTVEARVRAAVLMAFAEGRLQQFVRSGYRRLPTEALDAALDRLG